MGMLAGLGYGAYKAGQNSRNNNSPAPAADQPMPGLALAAAAKAGKGMPSLAGQSPLGMSSTGSPGGAQASRTGQKSYLG